MPFMPYMLFIADMPFLLDALLFSPAIPPMPQPFTHMSRHPATTSSTKMLMAVGTFGMAPCMCVKWTT